MFSREFAFCLFINYAHMIMQMIARAYDQIWKKKLSSVVPSRGLTKLAIHWIGKYYCILLPNAKQFFLFEGSRHLKN